MNEAALFKMSYGLYIVSAMDDAGSSACLANSICQVSANPIQVSVTLNKQNMTTDKILRTKRFNYAVLEKEISMDTIALFGFQSSRDIDKYATCAHDFDTHQIPYPKKFVCAILEAKVVQHLDIGSHILFVGEIDFGKVLSENEVLTYAYYHAVKKKEVMKKTSPAQASTNDGNATHWRCSICGYIYEGDPLPNDFICPLCGKDASFFEKIKEKK